MAIQLNKEGAQFLEAYTYDNAISSFQEALRLVKQELSHAQEGVLADVADDDVRFYFGLASSKPTDHGFVFQRPLLVDIHDTAQRATAIATINYLSFASLVSFSFALLFNLAVAMHLSALLASPKASMHRRFKKSLIFYELAYSMMQDESIQKVTEITAILNNIGQIHCVLGNSLKAKECSQRLFGILVYIAHCQEKDTIQDFDSFFQSTLPIIMPHAPVAQAA